MGKVKGQSSHADISNKQAVLTLITSKQNNDAKLKEIVDILQSYETISIHSHTEEYWKDPLSMTNDIVIKSKEPLLQSEWFDIFIDFLITTIHLKTVDIWRLIGWSRSWMKTRCL